ncbi:MAG: double-strand break repair helicase AddA, partial [Alphaproteobacteria bacterium]|nr:double-strand break repair helicase AddA [Alphaproteobacteria bacterium]
ATLPRDALARDLRTLTGHPPDAAAMVRARQLFATVLDAPGGLKIQTIHAFCQSLLARFPIEANVAPHFTVMDEATAEELRREAREAVLARTRAIDLGGLTDPTLSQALAIVTDHVQEGDFGELLAQLTAERGRVGRLIGLHGGIDGLVAAIALKLGVSPRETPDVIRAQLVALDARIEADLGRAAAALARGSAADRDCAEVLREFIARPGARPELYGGYRALFFTLKNEPRKQLASKACLEAAPATLDILQAELARLARLEERLRSATILAASTALLRLGELLLTEYERAKRQRVALDYDDLILKTRDLLLSDGGCSWVLYKLDGGLDHILIDEAQDTNPEQWDVIAALAGEFFVGESRGPMARTIFAVGDAKQSIFSFQRADPAAFEGMRAHFRQRVDHDFWKEIPLTVSFRSTSAVLRAVDAVFAQPDARDGVVEGKPLHHDVSRTNQAGLVELWPLPPRPSTTSVDPWQLPLERQSAQSPVVQAARLVARRIVDLCRSGERLEARDRLIAPGDILVLVRRRTAFVDELVRALKVAQIPVAGVDRMVLTDQLAVMDLIALGRFLLLPDDDLTLACVLKSPLVGLDEDALFALAHERRPRSLWSALRERAGERADFAAAHGRLSEFLRQADFMPPFELFSRVLAADGGRARLLARLGEEANDPIDEFLAQCLLYERGHAPSLEGFLHWLEGGQLEIKRDSDVGPRDEVRIMTVHGAKGLEAPVVILADTMQKPTEAQRLLWPDDEAGPPWGPIWVPRTRFDDAVATRLRRSATLARDREYRRLLYVAMTRAADRLYVVGWPGRRTEPPDCWYRLVEAGLKSLERDGAEPVAFDFAELGFPEWRGRGWRLAARQGVLADPADATPSAIAPDPGFPAWVREPPAQEPTPGRPLAPSRPSEAPPVRSPLGDDDGRQFHRGLVIHRLLQTLPDLAAERRAEAGRRFLARPHLGLTAREQAAWLAETLAVMDEPAFAPLFGPGSQAEVPLVGRLGAAVISGQIDRLAVTPTGVLILDYKTNRPPPQRIEDVAPAYLRQLATYRALVQRIYPDRPIHAALLWTDGPRMMAIPEALLSEQLMNLT